MGYFNYRCFEGIEFGALIVRLPYLNALPSFLPPMISKDGLGSRSMQQHGEQSDVSILLLSTES